MAAVILFILQLVSVSLLILAVTWVLAGYNGLSWMVVIVPIVVAIYRFITTQTVLGRHIYVIGGNPQVAQLEKPGMLKSTTSLCGRWITLPRQ